MVEITQADIEAADISVERFQHEMDITNADHIVLWLETNLAPGCGATLCYLACQIVKAHEKAIRIAAEQRAQAGGEAVAWIYPDDLAVMEANETSCTVYSVAMASLVRGNTVPLYAHPTQADAVQKKGESQWSTSQKANTITDPLLVRGYEYVRHRPDCPAGDDRDCDCGAVRFLDDLKQHLFQPDGDRLREALREARDTLAKLKSDLAEEDAARHAQRIAVIDIDITRIDAILAGEGK